MTASILRAVSRRDLLFLPIFAALVAHSLVFDFVSDDAYISFVYSRNFAEHGQLVFNLGERVEGYTNFLWTFLLGVLMKLGIAPELSARVLGTAFAAATLVVVARLAARLRGGASLWDYLAPALLAASSGYACWSSGGLETQMFTFFVTLGIHGMVAERPVLSGAAFALSALTRPEGALVFAVAGLWRLVQRRLRITRGDLVWGVTFLAIWAPWFAWRWLYYGWPFPNTAYVKAGGAPPPGYSATMRAHGFYYVWQWLTQSRALYAIPLVAAGVWRHRTFGGFCLLLTAVYLGYTVSVGGDFMGLHRFVMPLFVTTALLAALGLEHLVRRPAAALLLLAGFAVSQVPVTRASLIPRADNGIDRPGYLKLYAEDRALMGKALLPHMRPDDFSILGGAGVQPYYARQRGFDVFGLVSEDVAHNEPPSNPRPGHQKWARPERVLKYNPTFIFYCYDLHKEPSRYRLCGEADWFMQRGYEPVTLFVAGLRERGEYYTFLKRKDRPWP